jgi:hypothetical protein
MTLNIRRRRAQRRCRVTRVWVDGLEVTKRCIYADGRRGVVRLMKENSEGRLYSNETGTGLATEERRGHVRWGRVTA